MHATLANTQARCRRTHQAVIFRGVEAGEGPAKALRAEHDARDRHENGRGQHDGLDLSEGGHANDSTAMKALRATAAPAPLLPLTVL